MQKNTASILQIRDIQIFITILNCCIRNNDIGLVYNLLFVYFFCVARIPTSCRIVI